MWRELNIDFVAPPFAGHLFPLLDLAGWLRGQGMTGLRVLSTRGALDAIRLCGLPAVELLPGHDAAVRAIPDTGRRVGFHPLRLYRQFRGNVGLMIRLRDQLRAIWGARRPDLLIADFTVPAAGLLARELGIPWWTTLPSPCVLETRTGTPSYLGGWSPRADLFGRARDAVGRRVIRLFKRGLFALFARELRALGAPGVYRPDGGEVVYSPERILGLGVPELEFERDWPEAFRFVGPLTGGPTFPHAEPDFPPGKRPILVSLGTHLPWARQRAAALIDAVAAQMPDCVFHFAQGRPGSTAVERRGNVHHYGYLPYDRYVGRYAAALVHAGTGVTYSCLRAGVPVLVWPHDFDQNDYAARVRQHGLGLWLKPGTARAVAGLRRLLTDETIRARVRAFQETLRGYDARRWVLAAIQERGAQPRSGRTGDDALVDAAP